MYALILTMLSGGSAVATAPNEAMCMQAAHRVVQLAQAEGGKSVMCAQVRRGGADGTLTLTAKEPILVWQRPVPAGPQCDAYAALADPQSCRPYEQQRLDIERSRAWQRNRLDITVVK